MNTSMTIRDIDSGDLSWLQREASRNGVSMEKLVRRLIHEKRARAGRHLKPSEVFERHFGEKHGVDLPPRVQFDFKPLSFSREENA